MSNLLQSIGSSPYVSVFIVAPLAATLLFKVHENFTSQH